MAPNTSTLLWGGRFTGMDDRVKLAGQQQHVLITGVGDRVDG